jgi:hypothetical protein
MCRGFDHHIRLNITKQLKDATPCFLKCKCHQWIMNRGAEAQSVILCDVFLIRRSEARGW